MLKTFTKSIMFRVSPEFQAILKKCCDKRKMKMSDFIRLAIEKELSIYKQGDIK